MANCLTYIDKWKDDKGKAIKGAGEIDYVSAWYYKAGEYI